MGISQAHESLSAAVLRLKYTPPSCLLWRTLARSLGQMSSLRAYIPTAVPSARSACTSKPPASRGNNRRPTSPIINWLTGCIDAARPHLLARSTPLVPPLGEIAPDIRITLLADPQDAHFVGVLRFGIVAI